MQARGSALYLISFLIKTTRVRRFLFLGLVIKLGMFPFFQWLPVVIVSFRWAGCLVLTTIQKVGPLLVSLLSFNIMPLVYFGVVSIFIGGVLGLNQVNMRPLIAYSSISHTSWIILTMPLRVKLSLVYIIIYFYLVCILFLSFSSRKTEKIFEQHLFSKSVFFQNVCLIILVGIPPFSIFFLKMNIFLIFLDFPFLIITLIIRTYMSTFYYLSFLIPGIISSWGYNLNTFKLNVLTILNILPLMFCIWLKNFWLLIKYSIYTLVIIF
jgi:NADH:ubiquinone oxidoreductase subunit 2 (subunit N)